ncbi:GNAT family N-acetyltransferase [Motiliproteus sp. SC1-56]|uniref:GNAT family N-acetyltransferase n=1 Tax=Motiliproteus sp. SC1-56 TaxID=2799565 RepID=UPI001A8E0E16|nr:GNAT family N-acetyltransferase [Motiliproteus sp. SC1-56]
MTLQLEPIDAADDAAIAHIIRTVGAEYGAIGEGFGPSDPEVEAMSRHYSPDRGSVYWVARLDGAVVGGGGIAPFGTEPDLCELRKLFLLSGARGRGIGRALAEQCLGSARELGYRRCYLDTLATMEAAIALYRQLGFDRLAQPLPGTPHSGCDVWMLKTL